MKEHCMIFEPGVEENKLEYMQVFQKYHEQIEHFLQKVFYRI